MTERPFSSNVEGAPDRAANSGFTLLALHSADRMTRSLSPWTRQMLGEEPGVGAARHTVLSRALRRRTQGSSSFPSTLSILRRFHRIVTRSTAWKVGVGSIDPNLFDRFATDLVKRQQIGANNIPSLISLGEQRRREMDMPLAGAIGEIAPSSGSDSISAGTMASQMGYGAPSAAPAPADNKPLTMEEIKRRIEEAKRFKSNTPGSVPDFVRATQQPKPGAAPTGPASPSLPPGFPAIPGQPPRTSMPPTASPSRPPEGANPPSPETGAALSGDEQRVPPRLRRRRFASVEYVSMPNAGDDESNDKDEPSSLWRFATGPPGEMAERFTQWIEPFTAADASGNTETRIQPKRRSPIVAPFKAAPVTPIRARSTRTRRSDELSGNRSQVARRSQKPARLPMSMRNPLPQMDGAIVRRPLARLAATLSGQLLASRPQNLMAQVLRKESVDPTFSADAPANRISFVPSVRPPITLDEIRVRSSFGRAEESGLHLSASPWLAVSADDFALTSPLRLRVLRKDPADSAAEEEAVLPTSLPMQQAQRSLLSQRSRISAAPRRLPSSTRGGVPVASSTVRSSTSQVQRVPQYRRHPSSIRRVEDGESTLAQLLATPSTTSPIRVARELLPLSAGRADGSPALEQGFASIMRPAVQRSAPPSEAVVSRPLPGEQTRSFSSPLRLPTPSRTRMSAQPDFVAQHMVGATSRQVRNHTQAVTGNSPLNRAFRHLAGATSGQILASRPQTLMAQILTADRVNPLRAQPASPVSAPPAASQRMAPSPFAMAPTASSFSLRGEAPPQILPISVDDFVLPSVGRPSPARRTAEGLPGSGEEGESTPASPLLGQRQVSAPKMQTTALAQLQAAPLNRSILPERRSISSPIGLFSPISGDPFEPVSAIYRQVHLSPAEVVPSLQAAPRSRLPIVQRQERVQRAAAQVIPLELAMRRLLGSRSATVEGDRPQPLLPQVAGRMTPPLTQSDPYGERFEMISRFQPSEQGAERDTTGEAGFDPSPAGWEGIRRRSQSARIAPADRTPRRTIRDVRRSAERVDRVQNRSTAIVPHQSRPLPTLIERVLGRDFAGVRTVDSTPWVLPPTDAARQPQTQPSSPSPLTRPLHLLLAPPRIQGQTGLSPLPATSVEVATPVESRTPSGPTPSRPHLTRQLSQRLVQMSRAHQDRPVQAMEEAVAHMASSARVARRFAPSSNAWQPPISASLPSRVLRSGKTAPSSISTSDRSRPQSSVVRSSNRPQHGSIQRAVAIPQASWSQPQRFDTDPVRVLLEPGSLSIETLSDSSLLQRPAHAQRMSPLTDFVLARADGAQRMRASQPSLPALPVQPLPAPVSPLRPVPLYPTRDRPQRRTAHTRGELAPQALDRTTSTPPKTVQRRVQAVVPRPDASIPELDLRRAVQSMADRPQRYGRIEPISQLWRSDMLSTSIAAEPLAMSSASSAVDRIRPRRAPSLPGQASSLPNQAPSSPSQAPSLRQAQIQPSARLLSPSQALPLAPAMRTEDRSMVRRAALQVADAAQVAEAARQLPAHRRAERTVHLEIERSRQIHSTLLPGGEQPQDASPGVSLGPRSARLVRRKDAANRSRPTLLERVAARDFADLRRERLAEGPLMLSAGRTESPPSFMPSSVDGTTSASIPAAAFSGIPFRPSVLSRQLSKELVQRSGLTSYPNLGSSPARLQPWGSDFDPVSMAWPRQPWIQPVDERAEDRLPSSRQPVSQPASARVIPLELAMRRLLGSREIPDDVAPATESLPQVVGRMTSPAVVAPMVAQMEERGWRFKRSQRASQTRLGEVRRSVESLGRERSRPLARPVRTLMERVLGRDFAGVRVQAASMAPLGIEAAMRGDTVYLSRETARLDRPQSLGVLAHELTHVAARGRQAGPAARGSQAGPLVQRPAVQRHGMQRHSMPLHSMPLTLAPSSSYPSPNVSPIQAPGDPSSGGQPSAPSRGTVRSAPSPLRPHLTRQLSQRLVQMSLAQEERTAAEVEDAVVRLASSAHGARRFAPASHLWRMPLFEESPHLAAAEEVDLARLASPLAAGPGGSSPFHTGTGRVSTLPSLDLPSRSTLATPDPVDLPAAGSAAGVLSPTQTVSPPARARSRGRVAANPQQPARLLQPERTVAALEREGWRFKRAERPQLVAPDRIQRAVAHLQQRADRGMPLPRQPRTLMERVLQRDFSKVRVQTAPLQALGVEAAARDNTVYLAREQASRLDRAENLALLGHELTHVAASGNAPVQRSVRATGDLPVVQRQGEVGNTGQPTNQAQSVAMPMRPLLPATIQRTLAGEESVAAGVEEGLRTFLRQSSQSTGEVSQPVGASINRSSLPVVQRTPLAPRTTIRPGGAERVQRLAAVDENDSALPRLGVSPIQLKGFRGGEPTLSGVPSDVMAVAPRTPIVRRMPAEVESSAPDISRSSTLDPLAIRPPSSAPIVQRAPDGDESPKRSSSSTSSVSSTQESPQTQSADPASDQDADWDRLAEKVYPLIRRMLQLERERRPR